MKKVLAFIVLMLLGFMLAGSNDMVRESEVTMDFHNSDLPPDLPPMITMDFANSGLPEEIPIDPSIGIAG